MSDIDRLVSDIFANATTETNVAPEETMATVPDKGKEIDKTPSDEGDFDLRSWRPTSAVTDDNTLSVAYFIPISR
jgi:hypothetical protein